MLASFVIGLHTARVDNLLQTLRFLTRDHPEVVAEAHLEVGCQDDFDGLPAAARDEFSSLAGHFGRSRVTSYRLPWMWLPHVTNECVRATDTEMVVVLESDRILPAGYFASVLDGLKPGVQITCKRMKKLTRAATDEEVRAGTFESVDEHRDEAAAVGMRNMWSGNTAFCRSDFDRAGRMDEAYQGYGWADSDMTRAMEWAGVRSVFREELELHLWHPPATYGQGDQKLLFLNNGLYFCRKWDVPHPAWFREELATHRGRMMQ